MQPVHRKPTFSYLKRKRTISGDDDTQSTRSSPSTLSSSPPPPPPRQPQPQTQQQQQQQQPAKTKRHASSGKLQQLRLDLGPPSRKLCKVCDMDYVPANPEDASLHKKYHDALVSATVDGVDVGRSFARAHAGAARWAAEGYVMVIVVVDRKSVASSRAQARKVLDVVNKQLSAPGIEDEVLWGLSNPGLAPGHEAHKGDTSTERFKVFLYMKDSRCVGLCLAERIWEAHPVIKSSTSSLETDMDDNAPSSSITAAETVRPAIVGISRIWTATSARRTGVAMALLDNVCTRFIYGTDIPKERVAFSQPTESGCRLMQAFYGSDPKKGVESDKTPLEWLVYREN